MKRFKLEEEVLNQTDRCEGNFSCLDGDDSCLCEVDQIINDSLLYIKPSQNISCEYKVSFGYTTYYCNCPTRREIYKRYNK